MNKQLKTLLIIFSLVFFSFTLLIIYRNSTLFGFDNAINILIANHQSQWLYNLMLNITKIGDVIGTLLIFLVFGLFLYKKSRNDLYILTSSVIIGILSTEIIKKLVARPRPFNMLETSFSFPSAHAMISAVFFFSSLYLIAPKIESRFSKIIFFVITWVIFPLVAFSRIYLSVHWTSDVIAGLIFGWICFVISQTICCHKKENVL